MKKLINNLYVITKKEKALKKFILLIFIMGLIFGSLFINLINSSDKNLLINQVDTFFKSISNLSSDVFGMNVFLNNLLNNGLQMLIIFCLGISMIGIFVVVLIMFFKGFTLGTTISSIILKYQLKGVLAAFLYVFPVMIFNIIIYAFVSFFAIYASCKFLKALFKKDNLDFRKFLGKYVFAFFIGAILMVLCCFLDAFLSPLILKLFTFLT